MFQNPHDTNRVVQSSWAYGPVFQFSGASRSIVSAKERSPKWQFSSASVSFSRCLPTDRSSWLVGVGICPRRIDVLLLRSCGPRGHEIFASLMRQEFRLQDWSVEMFLLNPGLSNLPWPPPWPETQTLQVSNIYDPPFSRYRPRSIPNPLHWDIQFELIASFPGTSRRLILISLDAGLHREPETFVPNGPIHMTHPSVGKASARPTIQTFPIWFSLNSSNYYWVTLLKGWHSPGALMFTGCILLWFLASTEVSVWRGSTRCTWPVNQGEV